MAIEIPVFNLGFMEAAVDLSTKQFYCVETTADKTVNITNVAGENCLGVLQNKPSIVGDVCDIMCIGVTKVVAGTGGLTAGQVWEAAADGKAIAATTGKVGMGTVLIGATADTLATVTVGFAQGNTLA
jgi:hypothetical protein